MDLLPRVNDPEVAVTAKKVDKFRGVKIKSDDGLSYALYCLCNKLPDSLP